MSVSKPHSERTLVIGEHTWERYMELLDENLRLEEQLEASEKLIAAAVEDLDRIADWPHVKLYAGNETAYMPLIVHEWARAARQHFREASSPASEPKA